jgi:alpha-galactosidase
MEINFYLLVLSAAATLSVTETGLASLPPPEEFGVQTKNFALNFEVGDDGRLYQRAVGAADVNTKLLRTDEIFPQAGDGYVWEPALQVVHADGNTSTALIFDGVTRTNDDAGRELTQIKLHDPAYPLEVTLNFRADRDRDVIEQWTEIVHHESGPVTLQRMASTALLLPPTNVYLTHFFGDWAKEMLSPITEQITPGTKVLDSKLGVRADQFQNPSFIISLDGPPVENSGRVLAGLLEWSGSFQCAFDDNGTGIRALCGMNPFASAYHLNPGEMFTTPKMIWVWSANGLGEMSRQLHNWARDFGVRDGHKTRAVLLNNWEATGFDFDFNRIVGLYDPAKALGVELFLLDDGWFGNKYPRVNDHAGLGDWQPNRSRLPDGLAPLASEAVKRGLRFGIWMEPEMVNPKSELFEQHPDWVIAQPKRELELQRNQLVLDLTRPEVQQFEWNSISNILNVPNISYAKWDCNRYLTQPGSSYLPPDRQSHLWIDYVNALYALMDKSDAVFRRRRTRGLRRVEIFPGILAQRQHRSGCPRADAMGLFLFLPADGHRQPRHALGQPADALRVQRGDERAFRHGSRLDQIAGTGQGHLRRCNQRLQTNPRRDATG